MPITPIEAKSLAADPQGLDVEGLTDCWKSIAVHISYLNADDYGGDWKLVPQWKPSLDALDAEFDRRGIARPDRKGYLL